jgi:hypothetical protein
MAKQQTASFHYDSRDMGTPDILSQLSKSFGEQENIMKQFESPSAFNNSYAKEVMFPETIESIDNYIKFSIFERYRARSVLSEESNNGPGEKLAEMYLPLPNNLGTSYSQNYKGDNLGVLGSAGASLFGDLKKAVQESNKLEDLGTNLMTAGRQAARKVGPEGLLSLGVSAFGTEIGPLLGSRFGIGGAVVGEGIRQSIVSNFATGGIARNPHLALLYESPEFRSFTFAFDLRPKSLVESARIKSLIKNFKLAAAPEYSQGRHFFRYPAEFQIELSDSNQDTFAFDRCICNNIQVEYHGEGTPLYYNKSARTDDATTLTHDLAPAVVNLQLTFTEVKILTKQDIVEGK